MAAIAGACATGVHAGDRDALLHIVQQQCLPHWQEQHEPAPCAAVAPDFAVLRDRKGGAHFLLIATRTLSGLEDPLLLQSDAPNYFAAAWQARGRLAEVAGHPLSDDEVGLAVNSALARGQDQFHIHIECLRPDLHRLLRAEAEQLGDHWQRLPLWGHPFLARRVSGPSLERVNPVVLLAAAGTTIRSDLRAYTLVVAGARFADGAGFVLLAGPTAAGAAALLPASDGRVPPGETLLDARCEEEPEGPSR